MGFFDDVSRYPSSMPGPRGTPWDPPAGEFPCAVATGALVLARTEAVAVAVTTIWAFRAGFEFWIKAASAIQGLRWSGGQTISLCTSACGSRTARRPRMWAACRSRPGP